MDYIDLGKKGMFLVGAIVLGILAIQGNIGRGFACIFVPGALTADVTSDGSGSTTQSSTTVTS